MRRRPFGLGVLGVLGVLACASAAADDLPNPFAPPEPPRGAAAEHGAAAAQPLLELRATLVLGRESSVNIGGTILRVGDEVGDFRLVSVHEGAAVLVDTAGVTHVLEIEPPRQVAP